MNASSKNARVVRNRIFLQFLALCVHCPSRVSLYHVALLRHQWQSPGARSIALPLLSRLAAVNARDAAWVTRAWGNGAKATIIHGQGRSRSHDIKRWTRWWRDDTDVQSDRILVAHLAVNAAVPIAFFLTSIEYDSLLLDK